MNAYYFKKIAACMLAALEGVGFLQSYEREREERERERDTGRLSLSRNRRDPQKQFEISVLRHIRFLVLRKKTI